MSEFDNGPKREPRGGISSVVAAAAAGAALHSCIRSRDSDKIEVNTGSGSDSYDALVTPAEALKRVSEHQVGTAVQLVDPSDTSHRTYELNLKDGKRVLAIVPGRQDDSFQAALNQEKLPQKVQLVGGQSVPSSVEVHLNRSWRDTGAELLSSIFLPVAAYLGLRAVSRSLGSTGQEADAEESKSVEVIEASHGIEDVGGAPQLKAQLREISDKIQRYSRGEEVEIPNGVLLYGPPGTGKTFAIEALAGDANIPIILTSGAKLTRNPYVGGFANTILAFWDNAWKEVESFQSKNALKRPVGLLLIEEAEILVRKRGDTTHEESHRATNAILELTDSKAAEKYKGMIVVYATNHRENMDDAFLRPGRTPIQLYVGLPETTAERLDILEKLYEQVGAKNGARFKAPPQSCLKEIAVLTHGCTPDQLKAIVRESFDLAQREGARSITQPHVYNSLLNTLLGPTVHYDQNVEAKRKITIAHELGHGIIAELVGAPVRVLSTEARGNALAFVMPDQSALEEQPRTRSDLLRLMLIAAGGRAGEVVFGRGNHTSTSGVSQDFEQLRELAKEYVESGMMDNSYYTPKLRGAESERESGLITDNIDKIADRAVLTAIEIIQEVGTTSLQEAVEKLGTTPRVYLGEQASKDIRSTFAIKKQRLEKIIEEFLNDPLREAPQTHGNGDRARRPVVA